MKKLYTLLLLFAFLGCKKQIEEKQQDIIVEAMTSGKWRVTSFTRGGTNVTADFNPYLFQFNKNNTVDALVDTTVQKSGNWNADAVARTITSYFPDATEPLLLLNGIWTITNNSWTWVEATQTAGSEVRTLRLDKQ